MNIKKFNCFLILFMVLLISTPVTAYATSLVPTEEEMQDDGDITDIMNGWGSRNKPNEAKMNEVIALSDGIFGVLTSVFLYVIFSLIAFTTACDLLYVGFPPIRNLLYNKSDGGIGQFPQQNFNNVGVDKSNNSERCFISNELRQIVDSGGMQQPSQGYVMGNTQGSQQNIQSGTTVLKNYIKKRTVSIVVTVIVMMLLLTTSVFTDMGFNIGAALLKLVGL